MLRVDGELSSSKSSAEDVAEVVEAEIEETDSEVEETKGEELDNVPLPSQYRKSIIKKWSLLKIMSSSTL